MIYGVVVALLLLSITVEAAMKSRAKRLKDNYNLTVQEADSILAFQNNLCAICNKNQRSGKRLAIDHCHKTGLIRGALCSQCNRLLGKIENMGWGFNEFHTLIEYLSTPPAIKALGKSVYGFPGRTGTKRHRKELKKQAKLALPVRDHIETIHRGPQ